MRLPKPALKDVLESLYRRYNRRECIEPDPLAFVWRFEDALDREVVGLLSALLAYGRVAQIHKSLETLLGILGSRPGQFVLQLDARIEQKLSGFRHRFNTGRDMQQLLTALGDLLRTYGSLEAVFCQEMRGDQACVLEGLWYFHKVLWDRCCQLQPGPASVGMKFLLSDPNSAAKRMHLFLRWMVRRDRVDPGVWTRIAPRQLLMPVDTHILRLTRILGFHSAKTASLKTVQQITGCFAQICPADPVKYDFALTRIGISEKCTGHQGPACERCELRFYCRESQPV